MVGWLIGWMVCWRATLSSARRRLRGCPYAPHPPPPRSHCIVDLRARGASPAKAWKLALVRCSLARVLVRDRGPCVRVCASAPLFMSTLELAAQKRRLDAELAQVGEALAKARRANRAAEAARGRQWVLTEELANVVILMCWQAGGAVAPAVKFLSGVGRQRWPAAPRSDGEIAALVDECFAGAEMAKLLSLTDPTNPSDPAAARTAARYVQEWAVHGWASALNTEKEVAPRAQTVLAKCEEHRSQCAGGAQPPPRGVVTSGGSRKWLSRWRARWGGFYGRLRVRDEPPLDEMRAKVCFF